MTFTEWWRRYGHRLRDEWAYDAAEFAWEAAAAECRRLAQAEAERPGATAESVAAAVAETAVPERTS